MIPSAFDDDGAVDSALASTAAESTATDPTPTPEATEAKPRNYKIGLRSFLVGSLLVGIATMTLCIMAFGEKPTPEGSTKPSQAISTPEADTTTAEIKTAPKATEETPVCYSYNDGRIQTYDARTKQLLSDLPFPGHPDNRKEQN